MFTHEQLLVVGSIFAVAFVIIFSIDRRFFYKEKHDETDVEVK